MMSTIQCTRRLLASLGLACLMAFPASALELKPFKDDLFAYPGVLATDVDGAILTIDYQKARDIHKRDSVPELHVKGKYVDLAARKLQLMSQIELSGRSVEFVQVGQTRNATFVAIFIHGRGGDRKLGANDYKFGGNFNRIKNLAARNGGLYLAPTIRSFDDAGYLDLKALLSAVRASSPKARIVLACASMGSILCWQATKDKAVSDELAGMMILGGITDMGFLKSAGYKRKLPMFFSHGSDDVVYKATDQMAFASSLILTGYPARFVLFKTGSHGTPVRMTDWRDTLNWIFRQ